MHTNKWCIENGDNDNVDCVFYLQLRNRLAVKSLNLKQDRIIYKLQTKQALVLQCEKLFNFHVNWSNIKLYSLEKDCSIQIWGWMENIEQFILIRYRLINWSMLVFISLLSYAGAKKLSKHTLWREKSIHG